MRRPVTRAAFFAIFYTMFIFSGFFKMGKKGHKEIWKVQVVFTDLDGHMFDAIYKVVVTGADKIREAFLRDLPEEKGILVTAALYHIDSGKVDFDI
jgi:hypothetical protein